MAYIATFARQNILFFTPRFFQLLPVSSGPFFSLNGFEYLSGVHLDNFKPLNDLHGHMAGDLLLIEVAHRLTASVREIDTVSRFGGDEFVILLGDLSSDPLASKAQAMNVAEKIRSAVAEPYQLSMEGRDLVSSTVTHRCTACIGVVLFINHSTAIDDLLKQADAAMYQAKADGRNRVCFSQA